jgi:indole-3-glycerol phosphate synthase
VLLDDLVAGSLADAARRRETRPLDVVERLAWETAPALDGVGALSRADRVRIIAEVKRASPSRGDLSAIADPAALAAQYAEGGAAAISVLTEERRFKGSLADLEAVRAAVPVPVLRKEFVAEPYQVFEARAAGADLVLLIVAALEQPLLVELHELVGRLGMTALVETHTADELSRAIDLGAEVIGVNARNLDTFELDASLFGRLADRIPSSAVKVAESAVLSPADVARYRADGADAVLVGEALVVHGDPTTAIREFIEAAA